MQVVMMKFSAEIIFRAIVELNQTGDPFGTEEIAEYVGCHRVTVVRAVKHLENQERLRVKRGGGYGVKSTYEVINDSRL